MKDKRTQHRTLICKIDKVQLASNKHGLDNGNGLQPTVVMIIYPSHYLGL